MPEIVQFFPVILISIGSIALLLAPRSRWSVIALAIQYLGVFWLVSTVWSIGLASVKLVAGWMAGTVLGASFPSQGGADQEAHPVSWQIFRLAAAALIFLVVGSIFPSIQTWIPASVPLLFGGSLLIAMGLLQLGMSTQPFRVILGLLTLLSGFEVLYAALEDSVLVAGLLVVVTLGLAVTGSYLISLGSTEEAV